MAKKKKISSDMQAFMRELIRESLRDWFKKEDWVRITTSGDIAGPCGTSKNKKNPDRCLPRAKAQSLTKAERAATARKKKKAGAKGKQVVKNTKKATVKKETKEAPAGHYFTKSGNLVKGRMSKDAKERGARKSDPKDKQRSKVPPVTQYTETANPQDGKAAPYGSGYKKITKEDIRNLVVGTIHEMQNTNFKVLKKGPYYRYLPTDDLFTDLNQLGHHGLQRSPDNLVVIKTAEELLDIFDDMHYDDPERALAWADQNDDIIKFIGTNEILMEKDDRCTRIAKRKYDTWPSAYASGAVVRCRRGDIWKNEK